MNWLLYFDGLTAMLILAFATWLLSLYLRDVSIVDSAWSLMFLAAALIYFSAAAPGARSIVLLCLVVIWALRLSIYLTWRNWGEPEDRRYQAIREKYSPHFNIKSLGIIFIFQALLAWVISLPLFAAFSNAADFTAFDMAAMPLWAAGIMFESIADVQLARFKSNPANKGKVLNTGLWRYTRHPNYFGECLVWWGFYLFAFGSGAWWTIFAPLLMTWLLLKVSGVVMLEQSIVNRRPGYREYIRRTNAFIPGPVKASGQDGAEEARAS